MAGVPQVDDIQDIKQVFEAMVQLYGKDVWGEKRRVLGCMMDMAPRLKTELNHLEKALDLKIPKMIQSGASAKEKEGNAKNAVSMLEKNGVPSECAIHLVDGICVSLGIKASLRPDYTDGKEIPLDTSAGNSIYDSIDSLNHIRWFLNHQKEYTWNSGQNVLKELRKMFSEVSKNRTSIIQKYNDLVRGFHNNPYEESIVAWEQKDKALFTTDKFENYFVVIGDTPVPVGFAMLYPKTETESAFAGWGTKKNAFMNQLDKMKTAITSTQTTVDQAKVKKLLKKGNFYIITCLLFIGAICYLVKDWVLGIDLLSFIRFMEMKQFDVRSVMDEYSGSSIYEYTVIGCWLVLTIIVTLVVCLSMLRTLRNRKKLKMAGGPGKQQQKVLKLLQDEIPKQVDSLFKEIQNYRNDPKKKITLQKKDYRKELQFTSNNGSFAKLRSPVPFIGKIARLLLALSLVFVCTMKPALYEYALIASDKVEALMMYDGEEGMADPEVINEELAGIWHEENMTDAEIAAATGMADMGEAENADLMTDWASSVSRSSFEHTSKMKEIPVASATQSSMVIGTKGDYSASSVIDNNPGTSWQEGVGGAGIGERIRLDFDDTYRVKYLSLQLGNWKSSDSYVQNHRPSCLSFQFGDKIVYCDFPDSQEEFIVELPDEYSSVNVEITILDVYTGSKWDETCISEVKVYEKADTSVVSEVMSSIGKVVEKNSSKLTLVSGEFNAPLVTYTKVNASSAEATSTISQSGIDNSPMVLFDGDETTSWQEGVSGYGIGESLSFAFPKTYSVKYIGFKLGNWKNDDYYVGNGKPKTVTIELGDFTGEVTFTGEKKIEWLEFNHPVRGDSMKITIDDVFTGTKWEDTCMSEIFIYGD